MRRCRAIIVTGIMLLGGAAAACGGKWTDERNASGRAGAANAGTVEMSGTPGTGSAGTVEAEQGPAGAPGNAYSDHEGILLIPTDGWVDGASNELMIHGAMYSQADSRSAPKMSSDFTGTNACIRGSTGPLVVNCQPADCCGAQNCGHHIWSAAISLNFNQWRDPTTLIPGVPGTFNASALVGFSFELSGSDLSTPQSIHFEVETYRTTYDSEPTKTLGLGVNTVLFSELSINGPSQDPGAVETDKSTLVRISWVVEGHDSTEVPYDFCVSNVRALLK